MIRDINELLAKVPLSQHVELLKERLVAAEKDKTHAETDRDKAQAHQARLEARVRDLERKIERYESGAQSVPSQAMQVLEFLFDENAVVPVPMIARATGLQEAEVNHYCAFLQKRRYVGFNMAGTIGIMMRKGGDYTGYYIEHPEGSELVIRKRGQETS